MITVTFEYNEAARKWSAIVRGVSNAVVACQAFNAVALTCMGLDAALFHQHKVEQNGDGYEIIPAV